MDPVEPSADDEHQGRIKDVEVRLAGHERTVLAHGVLGNTEDGSNQD